jgi:xanthine dehydrogenase molybdopterin-binding subunit B
MMLTGKRHPFFARFEVGHDIEDGCSPYTRIIRQWRLVARSLSTNLRPGDVPHDNAYYVLRWK